MTLFTSYFGPSHLPVALTMVPPATMLLIGAYHTSLAAVGPHRTLLRSTVLCACVLGVVILGLLGGGSGPGTDTAVAGGGGAGASPTVLSAVFALYVFR